MSTISMSKPDGTAQGGDRVITYGEALLEAMRLEMRRDSSVFLYGQDIHYGKAGITTISLLEEFGPERLLNAPINENAMISAGVGAALAGMRPIVEILNCDFVLLGADALFNQAAKYRYMSGGMFKLPMTVRIAGTGSGLGMGLQHSQNLEALAMHFPGLVVVYPSTPADAKGLLQTSIRDDNPVAFFEHKLLYSQRVKGVVPEGDYLVPIGQAKVAKQGRDATVVSYGYGCVKAQQAAAKLAEKGIDVELLDLRTLLPLDKETMLASLEKTGRMVVVEEDTKFMGAGAELAAIAADEGFRYLKAPVRRVACLDTCLPACRQTERVVLPTVEGVVNTVLGLFDR